MRHAIRFVGIGIGAAALALSACEEAGSASDAGVDAADAGDTDTGEPYDPVADCVALGLPIAPFEDAPSSSDLYAVASDFTVPTTAGDWSLGEMWSGCDTYLFVQDVPRQAQGWPIPLWDRDHAALLERLPLNTHVFFVSYETAEEDIAAALEALASKMDEALAKMDVETRDWWSHRIHYVTRTARELPGWLGDLMTSPGWGVGVDRFQRIRYIGSYADPTRYDSAKGWFAPNLSMVANEAIHYNFEAEREAALEAESATVIRVFDGVEISDTEWTGAMGYADVDLPDAAEMAGYDTLELDLALACVGDGEYGDCPAWDYIVSLHLCDVDAPDVCELEMGRWITTYHREGRWMHDVSPLLPYLAGGGARRFAFYTTQPYEVTLDLRLSSSGGSPPVETVPLWAGTNEFDLDYNDGFAPVTVPVPSSATAVKLAVVVTGHGMAPPNNCAEFCNTDHHFRVNGQDFVVDFPGAGTLWGCMDQVVEGTVPNQYGTWWYGRGGWCPGKDVPMTVIDVTGAVIPGADNVFEYEGFFLGLPYAPQDWSNIRIASWAAIYK